MRKWVVSSAALGVFVVLAFGSGGDPSNRRGGSSSSSSSSTSSAAAKMGEKITFSDSEWTVVAAKDLGATPSGIKETNGKWLKVSFKIQNTTNSDQTVLSSPKVQDSKGRSFSAASLIMAPTDAGEELWLLPKFPPGLEKQYTTFYELPSDSDGLKMETWEISKAFGWDTRLVDLTVEGGAAEAAPATP